MALTPRLAIPHPAVDGSDIDNVPDWMNQMAVRLDAIIPPTSHGPLASRPASSGGSPGIADRLYVATDVNPSAVPDAAGGSTVVYRDNGAGWDAIGPFASKIGMGAFSPPIVTGNQDITGLGFKPKLVELQYALTNLTAFQNLLFGVGAFTETFQYAAFVRENAVGDLYYIQNEATVVHIDTTGSGTSTSYGASKGSPAMLTDGFRINWTAVQGSNTGYRIIWKAWG